MPKRLMLAALAVVLFAGAASAQTKIVAIGASNTSGFGVGAANAYPAQLEGILRAHGHKVQITNAGIPGETTNGMLARIDAVPAGTKLVIIQPGGNDARFGVPAEQRAKNIKAMTARLQKRGIQVIVADNLQGLLAGHSFDGIHFNADAHKIIAQKLYPRVAAAIGGEKPADAKEKTAEGKSSAAAGAQKQ